MSFQVVFFGTSEFAVPTLETLTENQDITVEAVITQPDKPTGRSHILTPSPIKIFAREKNLSILQPKNFKENREIYKILKQLKPDFFVVVSYGQILPEKILEIPKYAAINIHASLLPKFRGASPIQEALLKGEEETGISIIAMNDKIDQGDLLLLKKISIEKNDTYTTLERKLAILSSQLIVPVLKDYAEKTLTPLRQNHEKATYCRKIKKNDAIIQWNKETAQEILNKIKAFILWPQAYTFWNNKRLKILKASVIPSTQKGKPGSFIFLEKEKIVVTCKKDLLVLEEVQLEGKKEMSIQKFLRGYKEALKQKPFFET